MIAHVTLLLWRLLRWLVIIPYSDEDIMNIMVLIGGQIKTPSSCSDDDKTVPHIDSYLNTTFGTRYKSTSLASVSVRRLIRQNDLPPAGRGGRGEDNDAVMHVDDMEEDAGRIAETPCCRDGGEKLSL